MRPNLRILMTMLTACWLVAGVASGQIGTTTGSIVGKVVDASGGVLPGSRFRQQSSLIGVQTSKPPPERTASRRCHRGSTPSAMHCRGSGRSGARTSNLDRVHGHSQRELTLATFNRRWKFTRRLRSSTPSTHVKQSFDRSALARDSGITRHVGCWIGLTPSIQTQRIDVGGSHAGDQFGYTAYGFSGQDQLFIEGINVTYEMSISSLDMDFGSFDEISFGTVGPPVQVATPGVQGQMLVKSG